MTNFFTSASEVLATRSIQMVTSEIPEEKREQALRDIIEQAQQQLHEGRLKQAPFVVTLGHERLGTRRIGVDLPESPSDQASLDEIVLILIESATKNASVDTINYDSYDAEEDYNIAVDRRSRSFQIIEVTRQKDHQRWLVRGATSENLFENEVYAASQSDASFQARWDNAIRIHGPITRDTAQDFLTHVQEVEIKETILNPVTLKELYDSITAAFGPNDPSVEWSGEIKNAEAWEKVKTQIGKLASINKDNLEKPAL